MVIEWTKAFFAQLRKLDQTAWRAVARDGMTARVLRAVREKVGNPADAEDIMQDAFCNAMNAIDGFREECSFEGWLRAIALNLALSFLRRKNRRRVYSYDALENGAAALGPRTAATVDPARGLLEQEETAVVRETVAQAKRNGSPSERAFISHAYEGEPVQNIAASEKCSLSSVYRRIEQGRRDFCRRFLCGTRNVFEA